MSGMKLPFLMKGQPGDIEDKLSLCTSQPENGIQMQRERNHSKQETSSPSVEVAQEEVGQLERCICI